MTTQDVNELRAEISSLEQRVRDVHKQRIKAETYARSAASRLSEMEAENKRLREALGMFLPEADGGLVSFSEAITNARAALKQQKGEPKP